MVALTKWDVEKRSRKQQCDYMLGEMYHSFKGMKIQRLDEAILLQNQVVASEFDPSIGIEDGPQFFIPMSKQKLDSLASRRPKLKFIPIAGTGWQIADCLGVETVLEYQLERSDEDETTECAPHVIDECRWQFRG